MVLKGLILSLCLLTASIRCSGQHTQIINGDTLHLITSNQLRQILLDKADNVLYLEQINNMRLEQTYLSEIVNRLTQNIDDMNVAISYERTLNIESAKKIEYLEKELKRSERQGKLLKIGVPTGILIGVILGIAITN